MFGLHAAAACSDGGNKRRQPTDEDTLPDSDRADADTAGDDAATDDGTSDEPTSDDSGADDGTDDDAVGPTWPVGSKLQISQLSDASLWLRWPQAQADEGVDRYRVSQNGTDVWEGPDLNYDAVGLVPETTYSFTVRARSTAGAWSDASLSASFTLHAYAAPTWPAGDLNVTTVAATSVALEWTAATDDVGVASYRIFTLEDGAADFNISEVSGSVTTYALANLAPATWYRFSVEAADAAENWSIDGPSIWLMTPAPDPTVTAPKAVPRTPTAFSESVEFLFAGDPPVQRNVDVAQLATYRMTVLQGSVRWRGRGPAVGVRVEVVDHPEFGFTATRIDGAYDLVVNGGGFVRLRFSTNDTDGAERTVHTGWNEYVRVPAVALVTPNEGAIPLSFPDTSMQVVASSLVTDADGNRTATLLVPAGVVASLTFADGTAVPADMLSIRLTEYSVGEDGPDATPATLPPGVAYSYGIELNAEETTENNATGVSFSATANDAVLPVLYVEDFLGFSAGMDVPNGSYDRERGAMVPGPTGRVVRIVAINSGRAALDIDGNDTAASEAALATLGVTVAELEALATYYSAGTTLWRTPLEHFSYYATLRPTLIRQECPPPDANNRFQYMCCSNPWMCPTCHCAQRRPPVFSVNLPAAREVEDPCKSAGSIIVNEEQTLGESVRVVGTPFALTYWSDRVPGRRDLSAIEVPLSETDLAPYYDEVRVDIAVAGRTSTASYRLDDEPTIHTYYFDGLDAFGQQVEGEQAARVALTYLRDDAVDYYATADAYGDAVDAAVEARLADTAAETRHVRVGQVGRWQSMSPGLGGWSLDVHHVYDPAAQMLYEGGRSRRRVRVQGLAASKDRTDVGVITTVAGTGERPDACCVDIAPPPGTSALATGLFNPLDVAAAEDGSLYVADDNLLWRVDYDGTISVVDKTGDTANYCAAVPGTDDYDCFWDGKTGTDPQVDYSAIALGPDGSIYVAGEDTDFYPPQPSAPYRPYVIRRIAPDGHLYAVAGNGTRSFSGDGGLATSAGLDHVDALAVAQDGSIYVAQDRRVRRIDPAGMIATVAGNGEESTTYDASCPDTLVYDDADEVRATQAPLSAVWDIALDPQGYLYIAGAARVRVLTPQGMLVTLAGTGCSMEPTDNNSSALETNIDWYTKSLAVARDGTIYFVESSYKRVRRLTQDGTLTTVAGNGEDGWSGEQLPGLASAWQGPTDDPDYSEDIRLAITPDARVVLAEYWGNRVRAIRAAQPPNWQNEIYVPSSDGSDVFVFDRYGRHERTEDALSGVVRYTFAYDVDGLLATIADAEGDITEIVRSGTDIELVGPYGQTTTLTLGSDGYLSAVANPAQESVQLSYSSGGLLATLVDARAAEHAFTYNELGWLVRDENPVGGAVRLTRTQTGYGERVNVVSADDNNWSYESVLGTGLESSRLVAIGGTQQAGYTSYGEGRFMSWTQDGPTVSGRHLPDARFGMLLPYVAASTTFVNNGAQTLGRLERTEEQNVTASQDNPVRLQRFVRSVSENNRTTTQVFDAATATITSTSPEGRGAATTIDTYGRVVRAAILDGAGNPYRTATDFTYDSHGRLLTEQRGTERKTTYTHNALGLLATELDAAGRTTSLAYDSADRLTSVTHPDGSVTQLAYDANGNLTSFTPPGRAAHVFAYTAANLRESYASPSGGASDAAVTYTYSNGGRLIALDRTDGVIEFTYDDAGRLDGIVLPNNGGVIERTYEAWLDGLSTITSPDGVTIAHTYAQHVPMQWEWTGAVDATVAATYDLSLRLASQAINGSALTFAYDDDGLVISASDASYKVSVGYDAVDATVTLIGVGPVATAATLTESRTYDVFGDLSGITTSVGGQTFSLAYERDALGRVLVVTETLGSEQNVTGYAYNGLGYLTTVERNGVEVESYTYGVNGNRSAGPTAGEQGTYDGRDRVLTYAGAAYTYTVHSEIAARSTPSASYTYDALGRLKQVTLAAQTISYVVDGFGRRVGRRVNGVLERGYLYDGTRLIAELDGNQSVMTRFVYASGGALPDAAIRAGVWYRLIGDHLGSLRFVVALDGSVKQRMRYDAFGRVAEDFAADGFAALPFGFASGLYDRDTGLVHFGAREYDAQLGRWTSRDPILFEGGDANLHAYVASDPVNVADPDGLAPAPEHGPLAQWVLDWVEQVKQAVERAPGNKGPFPRGPETKPGKIPWDSLELGGKTVVKGGKAIVKRTPIGLILAVYAGAQAAGVLAAENASAMEQVGAFGNAALEDLSMGTYKPSGVCGR